MYTKLRELRKEYGFTCQHIATHANISTPFYCQIEKGVRNLSYNLACKIAKVFDKKPDEIFYEDHMEKRLK